MSSILSNSEAIALFHQPPTLTKKSDRTFLTRGWKAKQESDRRLEYLIFTQRQFQRCLSGLIQIVDGIAIAPLKEVMDTGPDPGNIELGERLLLSIQEKAPGLLDLLEKAMEARKKRGSFKSE